jgi:hypothetical protein
VLETPPMVRNTATAWPVGAPAGTSGPLGIHHIEGGGKSFVSPLTCLLGCSHSQFNSIRAPPASSLTCVP